jgi:hypothetical protein
MTGGGSTPIPSRRRLARPGGSGALRSAGKYRRPAYFEEAVNNLTKKIVEILVRNEAEGVGMIRTAKKLEVLVVEVMRYRLQNELLEIYGTADFAHFESLKSRDLFRQMFQIASERMDRWASRMKERIEEEA